MNKIKSLLTVTICVLFMGCPVRSLSPLFAERDLVFNPTLIGVWANEDNETLTFQKSGDKSYNVILRNNTGDTSTYKVQLGQLGKFWFFDSYPASKSHDYHLVSTHVISRVWLSGETFRLAHLEGDWLNKLTDGKQSEIPHGRQNGDIILTASTDEIQKLVLHYAEDGNAFPKPQTYVRMK